MATIIRLYRTDGDGAVRPDFEEFNLYDFGGQPPQLGDIICLPRGPDAEPEFCEVVGRYHGPGVPFDAGACMKIVVRPRPAKPGETAILN